MNESAKYVDELTGIHNRRYLREQIEPQIDEWISSRTPFSVVLVDIDHFKEINDVHGHIKGDAIIMEFADFLRKAMRGSDFIIRYGGDEFVCIMPRTSKHDSESVYRRLLSVLRGKDFAGLNLTVSAGIAAFPDEGSSFEVILKCADSALYDAKRSGRDQISVRGARRAELPVRSFIDRLEAKDAMRGLLFDTGGGIMAIIISGVLGIGKTRLTREVLSSIRGREVSWSDCIPLAENIAYYPIRELMKYRIERYGKVIFDSMPPVYQFEIGKLLPEYMPEKGRSQETMPVFTDKFRLYEAVRRLVEFGAREKVIVIDNMQWIDAESLEVFKYLMRCLKDQAITFIFIRRLEETSDSLQSFFSYLSREYRTQEFDLKSFGDNEVKETLKTIIGDEPDLALASYIRAESGGVPFYIEEIMRELLRSQYLVVEGDAWRFQKPEQKIVPRTLTEVIVQKCSGLSKEAHKVLELACVIGSFDTGLIKEVTGYNEGHILGLINDISRLGIVRYNRDLYEFSEAVTRNAIYQHFLDELRSRVLHQAVGAAIERRYEGRSGEVAEELAHHFYYARDIERGVKYCLEAARRVRDKYANSNALRFYNWAQDLLGTPSEDRHKEMMIDVIVGQSSVLDLAGKYAAAQAGLEKAERYAEELSDRKRLGAVKKELAETLMQSGNYAKAVEVLQQGIALAREQKDQSAHIFALVSLGNAHHNHYNNEAALEAYEEARRLAEEVGDRLSAVRAMFNIGNIKLDDLRYHEALANYEAALKFHREMKNRLSEGRAMNNIGNICEELGRYADALANYEQAFQISQETGSKRDECLNALNLADINSDLGNRQRAVDFAQHGLRIATDISNPYAEIQSRICMATVLIDYGDHDVAREHLENGLKIAGAIGLTDVSLLSTMGRYLIERQEIEKAGDYFEKIRLALERGSPGMDPMIDFAQWCFVRGDVNSLGRQIDRLRKTAQDAKSPRLNAEIDLMEADHCFLAGNHERTESLLNSALELIKKMKSPLRIGAVHYRLAQFESARSQSAMAREHREQALNLFKSIGAQPWINKVRSLK